MKRRETTILCLGIACMSCIPYWSNAYPKDGKWDPPRKSIDNNAIMDYTFNPSSQVLVVNFHVNLGNVFLTVCDNEGTIVYQTYIQTEECPTATIPLDITQGNVQINYDGNLIFGEF